MTTLVAGDFAVDMTTWAFTPGWRGTSHTPDGTQFVIEQASTGKLDTFHGTGFGGYDQFGFPTVGTINGIDFEEDGNFLLSLSDFSMTMQTQRAFANDQNMAGWQATLFAGDDSFSGSPEDDHLLGFGGDDTFDLSQGGSDTAEGDGGDDHFNMLGEFDADDALDGGSGFDRVSLDGDYSEGVVFNASTMTNVEVIDGAEGNDYDLTLHDSTVGFFQSLTADFSALDSSDSLTFDGSAESNGSLHVTGGAGDDDITGGGGHDFLDAGTGGIDSLTGGDGHDILRSHDGQTAMDGGNGNDTYVIDGGEGIVFGANSASDARVDGGEGSVDLVISDSDGFEVLDMRGANSGAFVDLAFGGHVAGRSLTIDEGTVLENVEGTQFDDEIYGNDVANGIQGNKGDDYIDGGLGNDIIRGGDGRDTLFGGDNDDRLVGGDGRDILDGGEGADVFHFFADPHELRGVDVIVHFDTTEDRIDITQPVTGIDEEIFGSGDLEDLANSETLDPHHAVLVHQGRAFADAEVQGEGSRSKLFLIIDYNGEAGFQKGEDIVIRLKRPDNISDLDTGDFF